MSAEEVDEYLRRVEEPRRDTFEALRRTILEIVADAEQVISYRVLAFRVHGKTVAGFAAFRIRLSYLRFIRRALSPVRGARAPVARGRRAAMPAFTELAFWNPSGRCGACSRD